MINKQNDNKFETIGGYPTPIATNSEKASKEYGLQYFKRMYHDWTQNSELNFRDRRRRMIKARKYAEGNQDVGKYKDLLDVKGDNSYMNIDWTPVSVIPKFVDVVVGDLSNQDYEVKATAVDKLSQDKKLKDKMKLELTMYNKNFMEKVNAVFGVEEIAQQKELPETDEELELHMKLSYKQAHEISLEDGIKFVFEQNNIDELKRRLLRDFVVVGQSAVKTSINSSGVIKLKYVDPSNLITSFSSSPDFKNIQHAGEVYSITISQLREMAGDEFTDEEYKYIAETYGKKNESNDSYLFGRSFGVTEGQYSQEYDKFSVEILDAEFVTTHEINYEKKENSHGGYSVRKRKDNFKLPKKSKTKREHLNKELKLFIKENI